jgi:prepilin-type processing-associated H-X9-DG protein
MASYYIIGGDGIQRGPVHVEEARRWLAEGRLDAQSKVRAEGSMEWVALGTVPEFTTLNPNLPPPLSSSNRTTPKTSKLAICAIIFGPLGLFTCGLTALIGLILGIVALIKISNSKGALRGSGLAITGICFSVLFILVLPILTYLAWPAFTVAKQKAESIQCMNNERQLVMGLKVYASQHNNQFPPAETWCNAISVSIQSSKVFKCPAATAISQCDYAFNARLSGVDETKLMPDTVVLFEADGGWNAHGGPGLMINHTRHPKFINIGFADGHVEAVAVTNLDTLRWNP